MSSLCPLPSIYQVRDAGSMPCRISAFVYLSNLGVDLSYPTATVPTSEMLDLGLYLSASKLDLASFAH